MSEPHGIDEEMMVLRIELDIQQPENSRLTLGAEPRHGGSADLPLGKLHRL